MSSNSFQEEAFCSGLTLELLITGFEGSSLPSLILSSGNRAFSVSVTNLFEIVFSCETRKRWPLALGFCKDTEVRCGCDEYCSVPSLEKNHVVVYFHQGTLVFPGWNVFRFDIRSIKSIMQLWFGYLVLCFLPA